MARRLRQGGGGQWKWVSDDSPLRGLADPSSDDNMWYGSQPNNKFKSDSWGLPEVSEDCLTTSLNRPRDWADLVCSDDLPYACQGIDDFDDEIDDPPGSEERPPQGYDVVYYWGTQQVDGFRNLGERGERRRLNVRTAAGSWPSRAMLPRCSSSQSKSWSRCGSESTASLFSPLARWDDPDHLPVGERRAGNAFGRPREGASRLPAREGPRTAGLCAP